MTSDCLICFSDIADKTKITCSDPYCTAHTCIDCTKLLIEFCKKEGKIPKCPSTNCKGVFLLSDIKILGKESIDSYCIACFRAIKKEKGTIAKKANEQQDILLKLRKERETFIRDSFPPSIATVALVAFATKLRRIEKQRATDISDKLKNSYKICMNLTCNGHLDENMVCLVCDTKFCAKCEHIMEEEHVCNSAEIESVSLLKSLIKCPNCGIVIQRSDGCDNMTCANCDTNFMYSTGVVGGSGSHNQKVQVHEEYTLANIHSTMDQSILSLLLEFEANKPKVNSDKFMISTLQNMYRDENSDIDFIAKQLAVKFEKFIKQKSYMRVYQQSAREIERALNKGSCSPKMIRIAISNLKKSKDLKRSKEILNEN